MKPRSLLFLLSVLLLIGTGCQPSGQEDANQGVEAYQSGQYEVAVQKLESGLKSGVNTHQEADVWTILGNSYDELDQYDKAIEAHKKALAIDPSSFKAWTNLGAAYRHNEEFEEARKSYDKALELNPDYPEAHASLGALYIFQNEPKKAVASLEKALALDNTIPVSHANIAVAYAKLGQFKKAQESLATAESLGYPNGSVIQGMIDSEKANR